MYKKDYIEPKWVSNSLIPWFWPERLDEKSLFIDTNSSSWGNFVSNVVYTTTWVKTVSWVWFMPKFIKLTSFISWTNQWSSQWYYYNNQVYCMYTYVIGGNSVYWWASYSSYCYSGYSWWNVSITTSIVPTTDGFTINVLNVSWWPISIIYECYQ